MKAGPYIFWALVTLLVFGWHMLWWGVLESPKLPVGTVSAPTTIRYLPVYPDNKDPRLKEILAPLIFSIPSTAGFSQPLLEKGAESVPPLRVVRDMSMALERPRVREGKVPTVHSTDFRPEVQRRLDNVAFEIAPVDPFAALDDELPEYVMRWRGDIEEEALVDAKIPLKRWQSLTNQTWEVELDLVFGRMGTAEQVFYRGDGPVKMRSPVLRWARSLRVRPAKAAERRASVLIRINPGAS